MESVSYRFLCPSGNGQPMPAAAARSKVVDRAQPHPATTRDLALPQPQLKLQPQDFLRFPHGHSPSRHPVLLMNGVCLPVHCPASLRSYCDSLVENIPLQAERHSGGRSKLFAFPPKSRSPSHRNAVRNHNGMLFGITTEWRSASARNRVHLRPDSPYYVALGIVGTCSRGQTENPTL
jgi:hypothetical protein